MAGVRHAARPYSSFTFAATLSSAALLSPFAISPSGISPDCFRRLLNSSPLSSTAQPRHQSIPPSPKPAPSSSDHHSSPPLTLSQTKLEAKPNSFFGSLRNLVKSRLTGSVPSRPPAPEIVTAPPSANYVLESLTSLMIDRFMERDYDMLRRWLNSRLREGFENHELLIGSSTSVHQVTERLLIKRYHTHQQRSPSLHSSKLHHQPPATSDFSQIAQILEICCSAHEATNAPLRYLLPLGQYLFIDDWNYLNSCDETLSDHLRLFYRIHQCFVQGTTSHALTLARLDEIILRAQNPLDILDKALMWSPMKAGDGLSFSEDGSIEVGPVQCAKWASKLSGKKGEKRKNRKHKEDLVMNMLSRFTGLSRAECQEAFGSSQQPSAAPLLFSDRSRKLASVPQPAHFKFVTAAGRVYPVPVPLKPRPRFKIESNQKPVASSSKPKVSTSFLDK